jgi:hypothetical protein
MIASQPQCSVAIALYTLYLVVSFLMRMIHVQRSADSSEMKACTTLKLKQTDSKKEANTFICIRYQYIETKNERQFNKSDMN